MNSKFEIFEDALIVFGVALSVDMIKSILGIILLVIQICLILYKGIRLAYKHAKDKNYQEVIKAIDDSGWQNKKDLFDRGLVCVILKLWHVWFL